MLVALSPAVTKFRHYRSEAQKIIGQCSRGLWEGVFQIWSNCDEKWLVCRRFCEFWATWPKLLRDARGWPRITSDTFADTLKSLGAFDLGMTFKVEVKVKVMGPTRGPTLATIILGPRLIVTEFWAWFRVVGIWFGTRDLEMTLTSNAKVEYARPTRGLPNKKKIMGPSLTVMEIWAFEVLPCFSIQGCVGLPFTRHRREHVLEHVRISILPRLVCIWWARRGEPLRADWVAEVSVARVGESAELLGLSACCCHLLYVLCSGRWTPVPGLDAASNNGGWGSKRHQAATFGCAFLAPRSIPWHRRFFDLRCP